MRFKKKIVTKIGTSFLSSENPVAPKKLDGHLPIIHLQEIKKFYESESVIESQIKE